VANTALLKLSFIAFPCPFLVKPYPRLINLLKYELICSLDICTSLCPSCYI